MKRCLAYGNHTCCEKHLIGSNMFGRQSFTIVDEISSEAATGGVL